ncbi:MAG: tRNA (guanosine(37)-N1)-methyltransferase TrmD [Ruminococcaceae bacterium]|nr:tRNA (guanosine(37)-N1)-methyltransferase TrmD [Oscillospiraceae bacterium]
MRFDIMTLFPDFVDHVLGESIIGRAQKSGAITVCSHNIRDYSKDKHRRVDDTPYGGGKGMLMMAPPIYDCYQAILAGYPAAEKRHVVYMSPRGRVLNQEKARELAQYDHLVILCGHYEGVDARIIEEIVDEEISIGDFVLTGGELPACILVDAVARLVEGVLADPECYEKESFSGGLLEYPQYTRPVEFLGKTVPEVLLSGHHANIDKWREEQSLAVTRKLRPELLEKQQE